MSTVHVSAFTFLCSLRNSNLCIWFSSMCTLVICWPSSIVRLLLMLFMHILTILLLPFYVILSLAYSCLLCNCGVYLPYSVRAVETLMSFPVCVAFTDSRIWLLSVSPRWSSQFPVTILWTKISALSLTLCVSCQWTALTPSGMRSVGQQLERSTPEI